MTAVLLSALLMLSAARADTWQPAGGLKQIELWPGGAPGAKRLEEPETSTEAAKMVGGRTWVAVLNVSTPTMTVYPPAGKNTGAAVVVFPGGGYNVLAIDLEGTEACDWLTAKGITCVLLKYRVPGKKYGPYRDCPTALADAQRALSLVRSRAKEWAVDPAKVGVLGFSAGGHMVAAVSTHGKKDERPDFAIALYPGHLAVPETGFVLNPDIRPTKDTPPTILIQAEDDPVDPIENSLVYYNALKKAGVPAELHVYPHGKHAFGLRRTKEPVTNWPALVENWLASLGVL